MEIFLVGGAVRDQLLGHPVHERDWVVVGATPETMIEAGFRPVGRDFPVFLHPQTQEEYALARTERKSGRGYRGFVCHSAPEVTLEEDLQRRDLTINAMAQGPDGTLVDPYGGRADLDARLLRHVSSAFAEDPLRILRIARFAARYHHLGFRIAPETMTLMQSMVDAGEVDFLVPERTWKELERALGEPSPGAFFATLRDCGALSRVAPELATLEAGAWHALDAAARNGLSPAQRFAALAAALPATAVRTLCSRLKTPNDVRDLALLAATHLPSLPAVLDARAAAALLRITDAIRRPDRFEALLGVAAALGASASQCAQLRRALEAATAVRAADLADTGLQGAALGAALEQARLTAIIQALESQA